MNLAKLEESRDEGEITEEDYDAIEEFTEYDTGQNKDSTVANHVHHLRMVAERGETPLTETDTNELTGLLEELSAGTHPDVKNEGVIVNNYISALRKFYRYHDLGIEPESIEVEEDYSGRDLSADDLLYRDEVDDLLAAANRHSVRDMAMIALTLATGQRIDAVRTLRLKHVHADGPVMEVSLNREEAALKGATGSKPLLWAKHYVRPWYESHPHKENEEAALFPAERLGNNLREEDAKYRTEPLTDSSFRQAIKKRAKDAGIEKDVYPHLLRHSAITRMAAQNLSEQQIKNIVGWSADSSQFETYVHLADEIATDSFRESLGLPTSESGPPVIGRPSLERCPSCNDQLPDGTERCPTCNTPLTHEEAERGDQREEIDETVRESYREVDDMDTLEKVQLVDELVNDPEVKELLSDRMNE